MKSQKFKKGECEKWWNNNFEYREDGLGIGSLHRWAKIDNLKNQNFTC